MLSFPRCLLIAAVAVLWQDAAMAAGRETLSPAEAARVGLVTAWQRQMTIAGGLDGVADAQIFVDHSRPAQIVEITANDEVLMRIPADRADASGQPIGIDEAERRARLEIYKLKRRGITATQSRREIPQVRLYALGLDGTVEARDAENGRLLWTEQHGDPRLPSLPMAINEQYVMFANGLNLYVLDAMTGRNVFTRQYRSMPVAGPTIVGGYVMTVATGGRVEGFPLSDFNADAFTAVAAGAPTTAPTAAPEVPRMVWPTEAGYVYAIDAGGQPGMAFRFPADGLVTGKPAVGIGARFFFATDKGQVYGLSAVGNGNVLWRQSLGDSVYEPPALFGERLFVQTIYGDLYCLDAETGRSLWTTPVSRIDQILGGTDTQLIVRTTTAALQALDVETGSSLAEFAAASVTDSIHNPVTDRLYLLTSSGGIQCLRPIAAELPTMMRAAPEAPATEEETDAEPTDQPPTGTDPFGGGGDNGADPFGGGADPFGGGADPFGGGGGDAGANDPFGGDSPFGN